MEELLKATDKLLSKIPFDGDKTAIGVAVHALLPVLVGFYPPLLAITPLLNAASLMLSAIGLFHKLVKPVARKEGAPVTRPE